MSNNNNFKYMYAILDEISIRNSIYPQGEYPSDSIVMDVFPFQSSGQFYVKIGSHKWDNYNDIPTEHTANDESEFIRNYLNPKLFNEAKQMIYKKGLIKSEQ